MDAMRDLRQRLENMAECPAEKNVPVTPSIA
jgi:hypothetical protein